MKTYKVLITDEALGDMEQIYNYISNDLYAPEAAMNQYNRIAAAILSLSQMPGRIRLLDSKSAELRKLRRMNVDNYSVFFTIQKDTVIVTDVLYGASDIDERLR